MISQWRHRVHRGPPRKKVVDGPSPVDGGRSTVQLGHGPAREMETRLGIRGEGDKLQEPQRPVHHSRVVGFQWHGTDRWSHYWPCVTGDAGASTASKRARKRCGLMEVWVMMLLNLWYMNVVPWTNGFRFGEAKNPGPYSVGGGDSSGLSKDERARGLQEVLAGEGSKVESKIAAKWKWDASRGDRWSEVVFGIGENKNVGSRRRDGAETPTDSNATSCWGEGEDEEGPVKQTEGRPAGGATYGGCWEGKSVGSRRRCGSVTPTDSNATLVETEEWEGKEGCGVVGGADDHGNQADSAARVEGQWLRGGRVAGVLTMGLGSAWEGKVVGSRRRDGESTPTDSNATRYIEGAGGRGVGVGN